ncbi:unnamed protein product [Spodoptera littoralis]|uniref:BHLH domain-containing protein n=1 Tax=Spodoptera littoralis TaxID=7109 RepID=A0A9P0I0U6_SPOLI|nr:unnamed protein product [Spodoptera littoralis]CAH1637739.1 unnamed protein product [Spodoptera littoralis]
MCVTSPCRPWSCLHVLQWQRRPTLSSNSYKQLKRDACPCSFIRDHEDTKVSKSLSQQSGAPATPRPKRGRPSGANRTPLSLVRIKQHERRARNAFYERERRENIANATEELITVLGCASNISLGELLGLALTAVSTAKEEQKLREINKKLKAQLASCVERLGLEYRSGGKEEVELDDPNKRKRKLPNLLPPPPQPEETEEIDVAALFSQDQLQLVYAAIDADISSTAASPPAEVLQPPP